MQPNLTPKTQHAYFNVFAQTCNECFCVIANSMFKYSIKHVHVHYFLCATLLRPYATTVASSPKTPPHCNTTQIHCLKIANACIKQRASIFPNSSVLQRKVYVTECATPPQHYNSKHHHIATPRRYTASKLPMRFDQNLCSGYYLKHRL